jgi:hypothetical protein
MALGTHYILLSILRLFQFALAITVCGLYGVDLHNAASAGKYRDSKWVYAEVVGGLSAFTAVLYMIPFMIKIPLIFIWDTLLFFLWIVLFGIFGNVRISLLPLSISRFLSLMFFVPWKISANVWVAE